jgi:hypothetical protein
MKIQSYGSFLDASVSHGIFHMSAQVKLVNLLIAYLILGVIILLRWYRRK